MARRCGCASDSCSCEIVGGEGIIVTGAGSPRNPYIVTSTVAEIETGVDIQYNNVDIIHDVHQLDFRGTAVTVTPGTDEVVVTVNQPDPVSGYSVPVGSIWMFGADTPPSGWLVCNGESKLIADYPALFAVIATRYGGNGTTNFFLPNLTDFLPIGMSGTRPIGTRAGSETKSIAVANLPPHQHLMSHGHGSGNTTSNGSHDHQLRMANGAGTSGSIKRGDGTWLLSGGGLVENSGAHIHGFSVPDFAGYTDGGVGVVGAPLNVMPPHLALAFIIKV